MSKKLLALWKVNTEVVLISYKTITSSAGVDQVNEWLWGMLAYYNALVTMRMIAMAMVTMRMVTMPMVAMNIVAMRKTSRRLLTFYQMRTIFLKRFYRSGIVKRFRRTTIRAILNSTRSIRKAFSINCAIRYDIVKKL